MRMLGFDSVAVGWTTKLLIVFFPLQDSASMQKYPNSNTANVFNNRAAEPPTPANTQRALEYGRIFERDREASLGRQQAYSPRRHLVNAMNDNQATSPLEAAWTEKLKNMNHLHNKVSLISTGGGSVVPVPIVRSPTRGSSVQSHIQALREKAREISDADKIRTGELSRTQAAELRAAKLGDECETLRHEVRLLKQQVSEVQQHPTTTPLEYYTLENDRLRLACEDLTNQVKEKDTCIQRLSGDDESLPGDYASRIVTLEKELQSRPTTVKYNAVLQVITALGMSIKEQSDAKENVSKELYNGNLRLTEQGEVHARQLADAETELEKTKKSLNNIISKQEHEIRRLESDNNVIAEENERQGSAITSNSSSLESELRNSQVKLDKLQLQYAQLELSKDEQINNFNNQLSEIAQREQKANLRCNELAEKLGAIEELHKKEVAEIEANANSKVIEAELRLTHAESTSAEHGEALKRMAEKAQGSQVKESTHHAQLQQKINELETQVSELTSDLAAVVQERDVLQQFTSTLKGTQNDYQKNKELVITLKEQNSELTKQLEQVRQQVSFPAALDNEEPETAIKRQLKVVREASAKEAELLLQLEASGNPSQEFTAVVVDSTELRQQSSCDLQAEINRLMSLNKQTEEVLLNQISEKDSLIQQLELSNVEDLTLSLRQTEEECRKAKQQITSTQETAARDKSAYEDLITEKDKEITQLESSNSINSATAANNQQIEELNWKLQEAQDECHKLKQEIAGAQQAAAISKRVQEELMEEKDQKITELVESPSEQHDDQQWKIREIEDDCHKLKQEMAAIQNAAAISKKVQEELMEEKDKIIADLEVSLHNQSTSETDTEILQKLKQSENECQELKQQLVASQESAAQSGEVSSQYEDFQWQLKEAENECHKLKQEIAGSQQAHAISKRVQEELMEEKDQKILELEGSPSEELVEQIDQLKLRLTESEEEILKLKQLIADSHQENTINSDAQTQLMQQKDQKISELINEIEDLKLQLNESFDEIQKLKQEIDFSQQECVTVRRIQQELIDERDSTLRELNAINDNCTNTDEVEELQQKIGGLLTEIETLQDTKTDALDLTEKLRRSQEENDNLRQQTKVVQQELTEGTENSVSMMKEEIREVTAEKDKLRETCIETEERLKIAEEELQRKCDLEMTLTSLKEQMSNGEALRAVDDEELASLRLEVQNLKEENRDLKSQEVVIKQVSTPISVRSESSFPSSSLSTQLDLQQQKLLQSIELTNEVYKDLEDLNIEVYDTPPSDKDTIAQTLALYSEACQPIMSSDKDAISNRLNDVFEYLQRCDSLSEDLIKRAEDTQALL